MRERPRNWANLRRDWEKLSAYERYETAIAMVLTMLIAVVVFISVCRLAASIIDTLVLRALDPLEHGVFQRVFGEIMTVLIALEFNHTLQYVLFRDVGIIQARIVVVIAVLALARKVIITDLGAVNPAVVAALAALVVALAVAYWLMRPDAATEP